MNKYSRGEAICDHCGKFNLKAYTDSLHKTHSVLPSGSVFTDLGPFYGPFCPKGPFLGLFFAQKVLFLAEMQ